MFRQEKSRWEVLQQEQRLMEEKNKRKKAVLAKAIAERYGGSYVIFGQAKGIWYIFSCTLLLDFSKPCLLHFLCTTFSIWILRWNKDATVNEKREVTVHQKRTRSPAWQIQNWTSWFQFSKIVNINVKFSVEIEWKSFLKMEFLRNSGFFSICKVRVPAWTVFYTWRRE